LVGATANRSIACDGAETEAEFQLVAGKKMNSRTVRDGIITTEI
jgi:hypothetical protein